MQHRLRPYAVLEALPPGLVEADSTTSPILQDTMKRSASASGFKRQSDAGLATELRRRFSFTPSEARIALLLAEGLTYAEIARHLGVSYHTVHSHVNAIHTKARVSSNVRLLALLRKMEGS